MYTHLVLYALDFYDEKGQITIAFLVHAINTEAKTSGQMGRLILVLVDVKYRTLISKFDVEQQRPNALVLKSTTKTCTSKLKRQFSLACLNSFVLTKEKLTVR